MSLLNALGLMCAALGLLSALTLVVRGRRYGWLMAVTATVLLIFNLAVAFGWYRP